MRERGTQALRVFSRKCSDRRGSVAGNSCEFKNSLLFDSVEAPHYNYVGDSILGYHAHMGAGSITT